MDPHDPLSDDPEAVDHAASDELAATPADAQTPSFARGLSSADPADEANPDYARGLAQEPHARPEEHARTDFARSQDRQREGEVEQERPDYARGQDRQP